ncbi:12985_t:CDS:1 [Cetraspora pellucida]|uniref:12985_t:CDS:1 n=1 Tax=Cetraspora pellucida TaxID=1433469 RepID=A0ACA9Q4F3_9GLOM|nr:12985_t:CDS:1 [Cetraspora pellucida]
MANEIKFSQRNELSPNSTNQNNNSQQTPPPSPNPETQNQQEEANKAYEESKKQAEKEAQNQKNQDSTPTNTPDQSNPALNQEQKPQNQPTNPENTPIIPPKVIQKNYNNDKDKSTIENNSNSTPEQKEQSKELLRLIIEAELLIKDNQFNGETLSKLISEKEQNTEAYQF